ncbi:DUF2490 domain-containing protein [Tunturiibacter gelidoferens]|uniref:DUF2490 domain-containing protein n=1 Tax=Tunturiibacter gelidiferens TaxID=3069689 RepID=A0A9X0U4G1_9BACT|nr:DUF2490 domain-containing protein [Edaphobacter lichenicola]MBB5327817.1 hypothetical protein [Edaphobacter lichenicola]
MADVSVGLSCNRDTREPAQKRKVGRDWVRQIILATYYLCSTAAMAPAQSTTGELPHQDNQIWPELDIYNKVGSHLDLTLISQGRFSFDLPNPEIYVFGIDANILVNKYLLITPSYYFYRFDQPAKRLGYGQNPVLAATVEVTKHRYRIDDRNRFVAVIGGGDSFWVYGNRLRIEQKFTRSRDFVFAWDELFYFSSTGAWQRNRAAVGFHKSFDERLSVEPYFLHQTDGHSRPGDLNTLGIILNVRLR